MGTEAAILIDPSTCDREPVHIPGAIQPFGVLVAFTLPTWGIGHLSQNAAAFFGAESNEALIGARIETVLSAKIVHDLRNTFQAAMISGFAERLPAVPTGVAMEPHDILIHASGSLAVAEIIPCAGADTMRADPTSLVKTIIDRLRRTATFPAFLASAARQVRAVTGYDRVMIYKFLEDESGHVVAEALRSGMTPFLHLRYPASDIPAQARALLRRQWLRMIPDVTYTPVPIVPQLTDKGLPVDLSLSTLRSASPIHLQYLKNMGVAASLTVSILQGDRLWGLIACHHDSPRRVSSTTLAAVELLAQVFSWQLEAKQQRDELALAAAAREAHEQLTAALRPEETVFQNLVRLETLLKTVVPCDGFGVVRDGRFEASGATAPKGAISELVRFLDRQPPDRVYATDRLSHELPEASRYAAEASGVISLPLSNPPKDYLLLFRREVVQTVQWGGDPNKASVAAGSGLSIGPRESFEAWKETVQGRSLAWQTNEIASAESLRVSLLGMMLRSAELIDRERRSAHESQQLLVAELNHRVKNILAVIHSLVRQSAGGTTSVDRFTDDLQSRIHALSVAHDQLTQSHWKAAPLRALIEAEAEAWAEGGLTRLMLSGPPVLIEARAYQTLALVFHEMMTNAAKYGALSAAAGRLCIDWSLQPGGGLVLTWAEVGGPPVTTPDRRGFGSVVIEQSIPFELRGEAAIDHRPDGVRARFTIPREFVEEGEPPGTTQGTETVRRADLEGKHILLVEDSMMIALEAQAMLHNCGGKVELAATVADARRALDLNAFDAAILDVNLFTETSFPLAEDLQERRIPFVFATGYGETVIVPERFKTVRVVSKPYAESTLRAALAL